MKRKVIQLAKNTLVVSLPASWCKARKVGKGDEMLCELRGESVVFAKESPHRKVAIEIDGDRLGILVKRTINSLYHAGVDRIAVHAAKPQTVRAVNETVNQLLGFHIIEQSNASIVLEDLTRPDQDLDVLFRRFLLLIKAMMDDAITALSAGSAHQLPLIASRDLDVNRLANLCIRTLTKNPRIAPEHAARMHTLVYLTEQLADDFKHLLADLDEGPVSRPVIDAIRASAQLYDTARQYLFRKDIPHAQAVARAYQDAITARDACLRKGATAALLRIDGVIKKAVSIQELFLHEVPGEHHAAG